MSGRVEATSMGNLDLGAGLAVQESGGALKVQTETPHLVSLGGGRLSTAVTLHPIPIGRVTLGSGSHVDILVQGTGVEAVHCHIENSNGVVTLYPLAPAITIDGLTVVSPTRLAQGVMLTIGRSNYMRFNHPAEAKLMKSVLPNSRISMAPIHFLPANDDQYVNDAIICRKPPAGKKSPRDTWLESTPEENTILSKVSKFELFASQNLKKSVSPKVFSSNLVTVNTPARDVLGKSPTNLHNFAKNLHHSAVNYSENSYEKSQFKNTNNRVAIHENGCIPKLNSKQNTYVNVSITDPMSQSMFVVPSSAPDSYVTPPKRNISGSNPNLVIDTAKANAAPHTLNNNACNNSGENRLTTPSPCFNRNPSYRTVPSVVTYTKQDIFAKRKSGSLSELCKTNENSVMSVTNSIEDLTIRNNEAEQKRNQAQAERLREQEVEQAEQARLEEILKMCAEYENQAHYERVTPKPVPTPNRIKTNGSLPRDKRSPCQQMNDETVFKFDGDFNMQQNNNRCSRNNLNTYENVSINKFSSQQKTNTSAKYENVDIQKSFSPYENVMVQNQQMSYQPQSPRTRIKTYVTANRPENSRRDFPVNDEVPSPDQSIHNGRYFNEQPDNIPNWYEVSPKTSNAFAQDLSDRFMNENLLHEMSNLRATVNHRIEATNSREYGNVSQVDYSPKQRHNNELSDSYKESTLTRRSSKSDTLDEEKKRTIEKLFIEKNQIQGSVLNVKRKIADIEIQEEELLGELDLEKSLLSGEHLAEVNALRELEKTKASYQERARNMEQAMQNCRSQQERQQQVTRAKMQSALNEVARLENEVAQTDRSNEQYNWLLEKLAEAQEILENERKCFEDLEFHLLEEEANMLATREELQREIQDLSQKIEGKNSQILDLESQQTKISDHSFQESKRLERQLISYLRNLEEYRNRVKVVDCELESLTGQKLDQYSDSDLLSDDDSDSLKTQLKNKLENIKLLKNQLSNIEKGSTNRMIETITAELNQSKSKSTKSSHSASFHGMPRNGSATSTDDQVIMSQSFNETLLQSLENGHCSTPKSYPAMSLSYHESLRNDPYFNFSKLSQECKSPSLDDIDRISKVTSDAAMDLGKITGSLGRKTIESLKEIERVRQIHLVQQGSQVIEEERKRVSELKRRVQDEVKAQWEERRQRECNSLNSVGSEDSAMTSSEGNSAARESTVGSEDTDDKLKPSVTFGSTQIHHDEQRRNSQIDSSEDRRPLSESSDISCDTQLSVKQRPKRSLSSPQQRPLTRYLPIRSDNLNLRQHIESAGHQVDLCPHVVLDSTTCRGYLQKMGSRFHSWNKRWFVFDRVKRIFVYYSDRHEKKPRGGAYFQAIEEVYLDHLNSVKSPNPLLTFIVKTHERSYHLMAPSPEAMRIWIDVVFTGAEGYQEFEHGT